MSIDPLGDPVPVAGAAAASPAASAPSAGAVSSVARAASAPSTDAALPAVQAHHLRKEFQVYREERNFLKERFVRGRARGRRRFVAVDDVSFAVPPGTCFGLIGPNGSGKSTVLKMLAGVYRPTSGEIAVNGRVGALLELGAGFHPELTGRENIRLNGAILGYSKAETDSAMDRIVDFAGIGDFIDSPVKVYSSGMCLRLGFAIAVALEPAVLLVDEVIAVGDEVFQRKCFAHLDEMRGRGVTILLVTHSLELARKMCDQVLWLEGGRPQAVEPAGEVIDAYLAAVDARGQSCSGT